MEDNPDEPNLVILTLKADDSRYDGEHSGFSRQANNTFENAAFAMFKCFLVLPALQVH